MRFPRPRWDGGIFAPSCQLGRLSGVYKAAAECYTVFREINREGDAMSQKTMLALLRANPEGYVSGEQVSEQLGLSRAAVWKAVDALRRKGYDIEARAGMGYRLVSAPDLVTEEEIRDSYENARHYAELKELYR